MTALTHCQFTADLHTNTRVLSRISPQRNVYLHRVLALKIRVARRPVSKAFGDKVEHFASNSVERLGLVRKNSAPGKNRTLDRRKSNEIVRLDGFNDRAQGFDRTAVGGFAYCLPQTLLQMCGDQKLADQLVRIGIAAHHHAADNFQADIRAVIHDNVF